MLACLLAIQWRGAIVQRMISFRQYNAVALSAAQPCEGCSQRALVRSMSAGDQLNLLLGAGLLVALLLLLPV